MIERSDPAVNWWGRIHELHEQIVTHWVCSRTTRRPFAFEAKRVIAVLSAFAAPDPVSLAVADQERARALTRMREQVTWGLNKINQFQTISQTDLQSISELSQRWLSSLNDWATQPVEQAAIEIENATRAYVQGIESVCLDQNGPRPVSEEYSPEVQLRVLHLTLTGFSEPVLDIGCGKEAALVHWLRAQGMNAIGIDLCGDPKRGCIAIDWFEFPFIPQYFGTIVAHLSYSLQFLRHHVDPDGDAERFAKQYMNILRALRVGGRLVYVPGLPFIERLLPAARYRVTRYPVEDFAADSQAAELYAKQLGEDPIYTCHVERI